MSAIEAASVGVRTMADGTLRLSLDIEPRHAQAAFRLFGSPGTSIALAALKPAPKEEAPKGGAAARWLGMRCAEPAFQHWLAGRFPQQWAQGKQGQPEDRAAGVVRNVRAVESRAEIDNDARAQDAFQTLIRGPWVQHTAEV